MSVARTLNVNGADFTVAVSGSDTLLEVLRDRLGLIGTKNGCNVGDCGACTVLVDGEPMNSCLLLAAEMEGKALVTVEGSSSTMLDRPDCLVVFDFIPT